MRILVTGSGGLVGTALLEELDRTGHQALRLVRRDPRGADELRWDPAADEMPAETRTGLEGLDAVVHLAGAGIADGRWTPRRKLLIESSRILGTSLLAQTLAGLDSAPPVLVCASAVGVYGNRGATWVDSSALPGGGYLAELCRRWEAAAEPARAAGIRVANMRFGVILHPKRGALAKMVLPFRLGLGGPLGNGGQFMSWIAVQDAVGAILHVIEHEQLRGPIDTVAPHPVTNLEFGTALAEVYNRKARFRMPKLVARLLFGELADELLLAGQRVRPVALARSGFEFQMPELMQALRILLERPDKDSITDPESG